MKTKEEDMEEEDKKKECEETEEVKAAEAVAEEVKSEAPAKEEASKTEEKAECPDCGKDPCECEDKAKKEDEEDEAEEKCDDKRECGDEEEIRSLGELTNHTDLAEEFIKNNRSLAEFKAELKNQKSLNVKENKTMAKKFSLLKALYMNTSKFKGNPEETEEFKVIENNKRDLGITDADIVVTRSQIRAIDGTEALNQTEYRPDLYTEELRPESVIAKTGCRIVDVTGPSISFAVATSGVNAGFVDLNGEIPSANMEWQLKQMTPKKLGAFVELDYKALLQDRPSVEAIVVDDIVKGLDQAKDEAILKGNGADGKPVGITATSGINEVPLSSAFTLSGVYAFEEKIRESNDYAEDLTWVMNAKNYYKYATTPYSAVEQNKMLIDVDTRKMIGHDVVISNALTDNDIILGNFNELLVTNFEGMRLKVVEDAALSRKQAVEVQAFETMDCLVRRPKSFTVSKSGE